MKASNALATSFLALGAAIWNPIAQADSAPAHCEVRKDGDKQKGKTGPCTFSQRQGYIDIDLRNGDVINLSPGNKANHFKDQKGNKVVRTDAGGKEQEYKWENGKRVTVTFAASGIQGQY